jgi:hypothetical protein
MTMKSKLRRSTTSQPWLGKGEQPVKVLVFTGTFGDGPHPETIASVQALEFEGQFRHEVSFHNPWPGYDLRNVTAQMNRGRTLALDGGYDAMLAVEHDMRIPPEALQALWDTGAPVAYGVYVFRQAPTIINACERYPQGSINMGESLSLRSTRAAKRRPRVVEISGVGFGCTLIRREVLERIEFRDSEGGGCDIPFAQDCLKAGIKQVADMSVLCGHWDGQRWLEPFMASRRVLVRALQDVTVRSGIESVRLIAGGKYELVEDDAREHARAGYVTVIEREDKP